MRLEHLWLACPPPAVREDTTVYAARLPLGNPFPLKLLKHRVSGEQASRVLLALPLREHANKACPRCRAATSKTNSSSCQLLIRGQGWSMSDVSRGARLLL